MRSSPPLGLLPTLGLALVSLLVGHELTYVVSHGFGAGYSEAMAARGHSGYWTSFVLTTGGAALLLAIAAGIQLRRLGRLAAQTQGDGLIVGDHALACFVRLLLGTWSRVGLVAVGSFLVQENIELWAAGQPVPLLGAIGGEHAMALPVLAAVSLVAAVVGALVGWRRHLLRTRIARVRTWTKPTAGPRQMQQVWARLIRVAVAAHGLRAPPPVAAA